LIRAQETSSDSGTIRENDIISRPRQTEEIERLHKLYQDQVEKYTVLQREFYINKAQLEKLNTLQSLESAIKSAREVMITRDDVLITYFELMRASLVDTEGIELTEKQKNIDKLVRFITELKDHRQKLLQTADREQIAVRADEFDIISEQFENVSYLSLALITIGDIQAVYDKSLIIYKDVLTYHKDNPTTPLRQAERDRAYREVERAQENTRIYLKNTREKYAENPDLSRGNYNEAIGNEINSSYSGTSQILFFIKELFLELT
jgi:hypothetical protein